MRLSDPHNMLSKIAVKRKFLPRRNPTLVPTIITQECRFNSIVSPQHSPPITVEAFGKRSLVEFVIVNHKGATILGQDTSVAMGVLHVDHPIIPLAVYTSLHLNRRTLQTQSTPIHQHRTSSRRPIPTIPQQLVKTL